MQRRTRGDKAVELDLLGHGDARVRSEEQRLVNQHVAARIAVRGRRGDVSGQTGGQHCQYRDDQYREAGSQALAGPRISAWERPTRSGNERWLRGGRM